MNVKKFSYLTPVILCLSIPSHACNSDMAGLLERVIDPDKNSTMTVGSLLPKGHPLSAKEKIDHLREVRHLIDVAREEGQRPERKLALLIMADVVYGEMISEFSKLPDVNKDEIEALGKIQTEEDLAMWANNRKKGLAGLGDAIGSFIEENEVEIVKNAVEAFVKVLQDYPTNREKLIEGIEVFYKGINQMLESLRNQRMAILGERFDLMLKAPEMCPNKATEWRIATLAMAHTYLPGLTGERAIKCIQVIDDLCLFLQNQFSGFHHYEYMESLLDLWNFDAFNHIRDSRNRSMHRQMYPAALPEAALLYNWSRLNWVIYRNSNGLNGDVEAFYQKALLAVDVLESQDKAPDWFSPRPDTRGMSRTLAVQFLQMTMVSLYNLHRKKLIDDNRWEQYRANLLARARDLAQHMYFAKECGTIANTYQARSFLRIASFYEDALNQYIWRVAAKNVNAAEPENSFYTDLLLQFGCDLPTIDRCVNGGHHQRKHEEHAEELKPQALSLAKSRAHEFLKVAEGQADAIEALVSLCQARTYFSLASYIDPTDEPSIKELADLNALIAPLADQSIEGWKAEEPSLYSLTGEEYLRARTAFHKNLSMRVSDAHKRSSASADEFNVKHFGWELKQADAWDAFNKYLTSFRKTTEKVAVEHIKVTIEAFRQKAKTTEDPLKLAEEYQFELLRMKALNLFGAKLWDEVALVLELRARPRLLAVKQAKSLNEFKKALDDAKEFLLAQRSAFPQVFNDFEELVTDELRVINRVRNQEGKKELTREEFGEPQGNFARMLPMWGWSKDQGIWLPTSWGKALKDTQVQLDQAVQNYLLSYMPTITSLDAQHLRALVDELQSLHDMTGLCWRTQPRLKKFIDILSPWVPIMESVVWESFDVNTYKKFRADLWNGESVYFKGDYRVTLMTPIIAMANQRLFDRLEKMPLPDCIKEISETRGVSFDEDKKKVFQSRLHDRVVAWVQEKRGPALEACQAFRVVTEPQAQLDAVKVLTPALEAYRRDIASLLERPYFGDENYQLRSGQFSVSIPQTDVDLGIDTKELETARAQAQSRIAASKFAPRYDELRAAANELGKADTSREQKMVGYPKLLAQARVLTQEIGNHADYKGQIIQEHQRLAKLKSEIDVLVGKLNDAVQKYVK